MTKRILLFLLLFLNTFAFGQKVAGRLEGVENEIENLLKAYNAVGLSVAVVENNQIIYSKGFGYRDADKKLPVNENTIFPVGSITKSFTSSLIGIFEAQKLLSVTDKPSLHISKFQFYSDQMDNQITIGDLLSHRSGLGNADGSFVLFPASNRQELMKRVKYIKPAGKVNDSWIYSNFGYVILGAVTEAVANQTWEKSLETKLFKPLKMTSSSSNLNEMFSTNNFSYGYGIQDRKSVKVLYQQLKNENPVGGINSNVVDLANYMMMWLNKGVFEQNQILSENYIQQATSLKAIDNALPPDENDPSVFTFGYGYGWKVNSFKGHYKVHHGGNVSGFSSQMVQFPTDKLGIVVLTNQNDSLLPYVVADIFTNRMLKLPRTEWSKYSVKASEINKINKDIKTANADKKPTHNLKDYCGKYTNQGFGTFEIVQENNNLFAIFPEYRFQLEHQYHDIFVLKATKEMSQYFNPEFHLNFILDFEGNIISVKVNLRDEPVEFQKQP